MPRPDENPLERYERLRNREWERTLADRAAGIPRGSTALIYAAGRGHLPMVKLLLEFGANLECRERSKDPGLTALAVAALEGHLDVMTYLLDAGARADGGDTYSSLSMILEHAGQTTNSSTFPAAVRLLLDKGARPSGTAKDEPPLAVLRESALPEEVKREIEALLQEQGADPLPSD